MRFTCLPSTRGSRTTWPKGTARKVSQAGRRAGTRHAGERQTTLILGLIQRGGQVVLHMLANVQAATIKPIITAAVALGVLVHTDEHSIPARLPPWGYGRQTVCHAQGIRPRRGRGRLLRGPRQHHRGVLVAAATLAPPAPRHLAGQAAALSQILLIRAQRAPTRQSPTRRPCRSLGRMIPAYHPGTRQEPTSFLRHKLADLRVQRLHANRRRRRLGHRIRPEHHREAIPRRYRVWGQEREVTVFPVKPFSRADGCGGWLLRMVKSFRMQAVRATLAGRPAARSRR